MRLLYIFAFSFLLFSAQAQVKLQDRWAWSAETSVFSLSNLPGHTSSGFTAEWYLNHNWSLRGGMSFGQGYMKLTTEPFALWLLTEGARSDDWPRYRPNRYRSSSGNWLSGKGALVLLLFLLDSDALCYNIPLKKDNLYFSVFASPVQTVFSGKKTYMYSLAGAGIKYISKAGLTANASLEYDDGFFFKNSSRGVKANFSVGYILR